MNYLSVKNLDRYQHYKDRDPKWIKLYYSILDDEAFMFLDETMRCRYMTCLILASRSENKIPADKRYLQRVMRLEKAPNLQPLLDCGLLIYHPSSVSIDNDYTNAPRTNRSLLSSPLLNSLDAPNSEFEQFWKLYPKKTGKKAARKAWMHAKEKPSVEVMCAVIEQAKQSEQWQEKKGKYIPHPATWLNEGRWEDQPCEMKGRPNGALIPPFPGPDDPIGRGRWRQAYGNDPEHPSPRS